MTFKISKFLRSFSYKTNEINRLLVSAFIYTNNIEVRNNNLIKELLLNSNDADVCSLSKLVIDTYQEFSIELLIELFEFVISPAEKEVNGAVYTPKNIRDFIVQESFNNFPLMPQAKGIFCFLNTPMAITKVKSDELSAMMLRIGTAIDFGIQNTYIASAVAMALNPLEAIPVYRPILV